MTDPPNEDPGRVAADVSFDEATPLDAIVGGLEAMRKDAPIAEDPQLPRVEVFVHGVSDADAMGLAEDVRLLLDAFIRDPTSVERRRSAAAQEREADPGQDVGIALHGLNLVPEEERVLHRLIRSLLAERRALGESER